MEKMKPWGVLLFLALPVLPAKAAADRTIDPGKAERVNATLKNDLTDQNDDNRRVRNYRRSLRRAYENYVDAYQRYGHGSSQAASAAKKVMSKQSLLRREIEREEAGKEPTGRSEANGKSEEGSPATDDRWSYYDEVVKQYGADSPQAEAVKRRMGTERPPPENR